MLAKDFDFYKISFVFFVKKVKERSVVAYFKQYNYLFQYGWPLAFWFVISSVLNVSDRYIIGYYLAGDDLGIYSAVYDLLFKAIALIYTPILVAGMPIILYKYNAGNSKEYLISFKKLILFELFLFLLIATAGYFLRDFFIEKIVGIDLTDDAVALVLPIIFGAFIWQLGLVAHKLLEFELKTKTMLFFIILALVVNITLNVIFIPSNGIVFASYATLISALIYLLLNLFYIKFFSKINFVVNN